MRLAYVCADRGVPVFGRKGCSVHVQELLRVLARRGHDVTLFASRFGEPAPQALGGVKCVDLPQAIEPDANRRERRAFALNRNITGILQREVRFDLVYERFSLWGHGAMEYARARDTPSILEVNAPLIAEQAMHRTLVDPSLAEQSARRAFAAAGAIAAVSDEVADWVRGLAPHEANIQVVSNGVCPDRFSPAVPPIRNMDRRNFTVGFVGSLRPWHGLDHLLDAYVQLHEARSGTRLLVVGDGPQREALQQRVATLPTDARRAIECIGAVAPEEVPAWLTSMHVAVAPYARDAEFYFSPLKVFEYMAAGRAVVASGAGQLTTVLDHTETGLLTAAGDAHELAAALITLYDQPQLVKRLGAAAREAVLRKHTWDAVADRILEMGADPSNYRNDSLVAP